MPMAAVAAAATKFGPILAKYGPQVANVLSSVLGSRSAKKSGSSAGSFAEEAQKQQIEAARADLAFRQKMYEEAQAKYGPLEQQILGQAISNEPLGYDMLSGQIQQQYADALRNLSAMGYQGGGLAGGAARQAQFGMAEALPQAYAQGQMNRLNLGTSLLARNPAYGLGQNVSGAYQNLANAYGNQFDVYNRLGMMSSLGLGQSLQGLGYGMGQTQGLPQMLQGGQSMFNFAQRPSALMNPSNILSAASTYNPSNPFGSPSFPLK